MKHSFDVKIAQKYGMASAVILENIYYWIKKNEANKKHFHNNTYWTYNSTQAFTELFPYLNERQIRYALQKLIDGKIIITGNYNSNPYDRTLWYAITKDGYKLFKEDPKSEKDNDGKSNSQNCNIDVTILADADCNIVNSDTDINISDSSDTRYNNQLEKEINVENIINEENRGICNMQNPVPAKSTLFNKQSSSTRTEELKELMSDKISSSRQTPSERAMGKTAKMLEHLQTYILKLDEPQKVKECYCQWLKILAENKKLITKDQLVLAIEYLNRETDDEEVKIEAIKLASMKAYRDFEYVIDKAIENIKGDPNDFLHFGGKNKEYTKISDIAARQAEEFSKEMEAHPEKYVVPDFF